MEEREDTKRIFVGGLFSGVTKEALQERFSRFGHVESVEIKVKKTGTNSDRIITRSLYQIQTI